jgi:hypothetical protein
MSPMIHDPLFASAATAVGMVLLWIVAVVGALLALGVLLPMHVRAAGSVDDLSLEGQARIRWAWGLVSVRLTQEQGVTLHLVGLRMWTFRRRGPKDTPDDEPKGRKKRTKESTQWLLRHRLTALQLLKRLIRTLRLQLQVRGTLGLDDPAATALVTRGLANLLGASEAVSWQVEPDWLDERVLLNGEFRARIWLAHLGLVLLGGLLHRETRQMIRTAPRAR